MLYNIFMTKNPIINAVSASLYIVLVACVMFYGTRNLPEPDSIIAPIAIVSLFTLSAAVMGYVFLFQSALLLLDGKKNAAVKLFRQTVAIFAVITIVILSLLFSGVFS